MIIDYQSRMQCDVRVCLSFFHSIYQGPIEILLELCQDLRREKAAVGSDAQAHMGSAKILVVSHDISFTLRMC